MMDFSVLPCEVDPYVYQDPRDELDDRGWGCVWRNAQTVIAAMGFSPPSLDQMMARLGIARTAGRPIQEYWIEPHQAQVVIEPYSAHGARLEARLYKFGDPPSIRRFRGGESLSRDHTGLTTLLMAIRESGVPAIIDDSVMSYLLYGSELRGGEQWLLIGDPHVGAGNEARRWMTAAIFLTRPWMVLAWSAKRGG